MIELTYNEKTALLILDFGHGDQDIVNVVSLTSSKLTLQDPEDGYTFTGTRVEWLMPRRLRQKVTRFIKKIFW